MQTPFPPTIYAQQLFHLGNGRALYEPDPRKLGYDRVRVGDVGFIHREKGYFRRLFNICHDATHAINGGPDHNQAVANQDNEEDPLPALPPNFATISTNLRELIETTHLPADPMTSKSIKNIGARVAVFSPG